MCIIPVSKLQKLNEPSKSAFFRRNRKLDSFRVKRFNNESQYKYVTSPNRNIRMGMTHDGEIDVWGKYITVRGSGSFKSPAAICNPYKIFSSDRACAVLNDKGDLWMWGMFPWNIDPSLLSVWFLERQKFPIRHVDFCHDCLLVTDSRGRVLAIDSEHNKGRHAYLDAFRDVKMTSTHNVYPRQHTLFLYESGSVVTANVGCEGVCDVPHDVKFLEVEAHHCISTGLTTEGEIKIWGGLDRRWDFSNWSLPWKISDEAMMKFAIDYGMYLSMHRLPRRIKRSMDFKSVRMMQKMAMD